MRMVFSGRISRRHIRSRCATLFAQLGARGVSVLFSSGDNGVGAGDCNDGPGNTRFVPDLPVTCTVRLPFITPFKDKFLIKLP
jgi:hypothetical protein